MQRPDDDGELLIELVSEALGLLEEEGHAALEAFLAEHSEHASTIRRRLAVLASGGLNPSAPEDELPDVLGDYRLESRLGQGGMGVVWRATQRSLGREVAVKLVRPDQLLFDGARERFRREVETVARLQHPGIVPVFGVGEERGLPYYAMELVRGASLAHVLERVEGRDPAELDGRDLWEVLPDDGSGDDPPPLFDGPWHETCARIALEVAEALEHARRRGVVHRDVKPSNVMLTRGGRVLLLDFGLSATSGGERLTKTGAAVGSLAYMAPERMPGAPPEIGDSGPEDPRQDVYSLGLTLYELLALAAAYEREDRVGLLRAAMSGAIVPLRRRNRRVPTDLLTVVSAAVEHQAARRYANAGALARDLSNALERRPLEARPPGVLLRARRWIQRNPVAATLYAAAVVVPTLLFVQEVRSRRVLEEKNAEIAQQTLDLEDANEDLGLALARTGAQRARAESALDKAMEAVDRMLVRVGDEALVDVPGLEGVRRELLAEALVFQRWFLDNAGRTGPLRRRVASVAASTADVHGMLGDYDEALEALALAEEVLAEQDEPEGGVAERPLLLAEVRALRAKLEGLERDSSAAERAAEEALEALADGTARGPAEQALRCQVRVDRAQRLLEGGQLGPAERELLGAIEEAHPAYDAWTGDADASADLLSELARAYTSLAVARDTRVQNGPGAIRGEFDTALVAEGLEAADEARRLAEELLELRPDAAATKHRLARAASVQGVLCSRMAAVERSREALTRTVQLLEELTAAHPQVPTYHFDLGTALGNLGGLVQPEQDPAAAEALMQRGVDALAEYFASGGSEIQVRISYAAQLLNLGSMRQYAGDMQAAFERYAEGLAALDVALRAAPDNPSARYVEAVALEQSLPEFAIAERADELAELLRPFLARAATDDAALELLGTLASWPDAVIEEGSYEDEQVEAVVRTVDDVAAALLAELVAAGRFTRQRLRSDARLEPLRYLVRSSAVLEGR